MIANFLSETNTSGIKGRVLYSEAITAPYAPADDKATKSPAPKGGRLASR